MNVSVIIPTYNGAHKIMNVLRCIERQTAQPDEVIVVIDGSTDGTATRLAAEHFTFKSFNIIEQPNSGRAKVRNRGAKEAAGKLLVFFDDDMRPGPECLSVHIQHHQEFPGSIMTGAQIEETSQNTPDFLRFKASLSIKWYKPYFSKNKIETKENLFLTAANFSISKLLFNALGGFDDRLTDAEDYDLAVRAFQAGTDLFVKPEAHAWHDDPVTCKRYIQRQLQYKLAHEQLQLLKPQLHQKDNKYAIKAPTGIKALLFRIFSLEWWVKAIDANGMVKVLPHAIRYKLYDVIITANVLAK